MTTPRRVFESVADLARTLGCTPAALSMTWLERCGRGYALRPLDEAAYAAWHRRVWRGGLGPKPKGG